MAGASEIRIRIGSITETKKVTDAMYMISSVKMRKAKRELDATRPYFNALREEIGELLQYFPKTVNRYFRNTDEEGIRGRAIVLITSDKGLAGTYNQEAIKAAERELSLHEDAELFLIGEYGRQYFQQRHARIREDFFFPAAFPTVYEAQRICTQLLESYHADLVDEIDLIYTDFHTGRPSTVERQCLLPLDMSDFYAEEAALLPFGKTYLPDAETVLNGIVPPYLTGFLYSALVESYSSEQNARMMAMQTAGTNAENMLRELRLEYNHVRQEAITNEIIEISAGAKALREKKEKAQKEASK